MGYWNSRGLRGSGFEELINMTNEVYRQRGLAIIQKIPTPITPIKLDKSKGVITLAYFDQKSTVDYIGAAQGIPICFDAKQTAQGRLPLQNIHQHQLDFMSEFQKNEGIAFLLVNFSDKDESYFLPFEVLEKFYLEAKNGGESQFLILLLKKNTKFLTKTAFPFTI